MTKRPEEARKVMEALLAHPAASDLGDAFKEHIAQLIEVTLPVAARERGRTAIAALEMGELILANVISRRALFEALKELTKEKLDMAIKASENTRKANAAQTGGALARPAAKKGQGIGSRIKPLLQKAEGAVEEALVETPVYVPPRD